MKLQPPASSLRPPVIRLLMDEACTGVWNMAVDQAILEQAGSEPDVFATLRWYRWSEPTLSLGYFQSISERPCELAQAACVRRVTGGGAILHDRELTYSLVLPTAKSTMPSSSFILHPSSLFRTDPRAMVRFLHRLVSDEIRSCPPLMISPRLPRSQDEAFLCFDRRSSGDLLLGRHKVLGSAQRIRSGALLQHGSILLERSASTPDFHGLVDCGAQILSTGQLVTMARSDMLAMALSERLSQEWRLAIEPGMLTDVEKERTEVLRDEKYCQSGWTERR